jgi:hypothetical protein
VTRVCASRSVVFIATARPRLIVPASAAAVGVSDRVTGDGSFITGRSATRRDRLGEIPTALCLPRRRDRRSWVGTNPGPAGFCVATLLPVESRPVFADPSGRRRRIMRRVGLGSAAALVVCMGAVVVAVAGGPQAPFTDWAAPHARAAVPGSGRSGTPDRGDNAGPSQPGAQSGRALSPLPSAGSSPRPGVSAAPAGSSSRPGGSAAPSSPAVPSSSSFAAAPSSPVPANPAGRTPPGSTRSPNPHTSSHGP